MRNLPALLPMLICCGLPVALVPAAWAAARFEVQGPEMKNGLATWVITSDYQDYDIRHLGASRPHGCEGFVARGIDENDMAVLELHIIGTDMLGDSARLRFREIRFPYRI